MLSPGAAVTNVSCVVNNWSSMTCDWGLNHVPLRDSDFRTELSWGTSGRAVESCPVISNKTQCIWPEGQFAMGRVYTIVVTVLTFTRFGDQKEQIQSEPFTFDTNNLVRPDAVMDVASMNINGTCVELSWKPPSIEPLLCRVHYNCSTWQENCEFAEVRGNSAQLCHLLPWTMYLFNVSCRPERGGFWSDTAILFTTTNKDTPTVAPQIHPGSFVEVESEKPHQRGIVIFWKSIPKELEAGNLALYKIVARDTEGDTNTTFISSSHKSLEYSFKAEHTYEIEASACTAARLCSHPSNHIIIPPRSTSSDLASPKDFTVELIQGETERDPAFLNVTWHPLSPTPNLQSYTVFWCIGSNSVCQKSLDWKMISVDTASYRLELPWLNIYSFRKYLVGISAEYRLPESRRRRSVSPIVSSGIVWSSCLYGPPEVPTRAPENLRQSSVASSDSVEVSWDTLSCVGTPSQPTAIIISYCVAEQDGWCTEKEIFMKVSGTATAGSISDLEAGKYYRVRVKIESLAGVGPISTSITVKMLAWPGLALLLPLCITFGILFIILLIVFFTLLGCKKLKNPDKLDIEIPGEEHLIQPSKTETDGPRPSSDILPPMKHSKNGNFKQENKKYSEAEAVENPDLLTAVEYREKHPSPRERESSSRSSKKSACYMVPEVTKRTSRYNRGSETNEDPQRPVSGLPSRYSDSFPLLEVKDPPGGIARERVSSFKRNLPSPDYGFNPDAIGYDDMINSPIERDSSSAPLLPDSQYPEERRNYVVPPEELEKKKKPEKERRKHSSPSKSDLKKEKSHKKSKPPKPSPTQEPMPIQFGIGADYRHGSNHHLPDATADLDSHPPPPSVYYAPKNHHHPRDYYGEVVPPPPLNDQYQSNDEPVLAMNPTYYPVTYAPVHSPPLAREESPPRTDPHLPPVSQMRYRPPSVSDLPPPPPSSSPPTTSNRPLSLVYQPTPFMDLSNPHPPPPLPHSPPEPEPVGPVFFPTPLVNIDNPVPEVLPPSNYPPKRLRSLSTEDSKPGDIDSRIELDPGQGPPPKPPHFPPNEESISAQLAFVASPAPTQDATKSSEDKEEVRHKSPVAKPRTKSPVSPRAPLLSSQSSIDSPAPSSPSLNTTIDISSMFVELFPSGGVTIERGEKSKIPRRVPVSQSSTESDSVEMRSKIPRLESTSSSGSRQSRKSNPPPVAPKPKFVKSKSYERKPSQNSSPSGNVEYVSMSHDKS